MPRPGPAPAGRVAGVLLALLLAGCTSGSGDVAPEAAPSAVPVAPSSAPATSRMTLPPGPLSRFAPSPDDVPAGLLPIVSGSGPRDLDAVAAFSADPAAAATALRAHGFRQAYVAQYAEQQADGRVLSAVIAEFATLKGAADDLAGDVAAGGEAAPADVGQGGTLRTQPLPGGRGQLSLLRFRVGTRTFLLALGAPQAADDDVLQLGRVLAERAAPAA